MEEQFTNQTSDHSMPAAQNVTGLNILRVGFRTLAITFVFFIALPLMSFLLTQNLNESRQELSKDKNTIDFPTILSFNDMFTESYTSPTISKDKFTFAFPLSLLGKNIKYGLPEIDISIVQEDDTLFNFTSSAVDEMVIVESIQNPKFRKQNTVLRKYLVSIPNSSFSKSAHSYLSGFKKIARDIAHNLANPVKKTYIQQGDGSYKLTIGSQDKGNVFLGEKTYCLKHEYSDIYVLEIFLRNKSPKNAGLGFSVLSNSNMKIYTWNSSQSVVKTPFTKLNFVRFTYLFVCHYIILTCVFVFTWRLFGFVIKNAIKLMHI